MFKYSKILFKCRKITIQILVTFTMFFFFMIVIFLVIFNKAIHELNLLNNENQSFIAPEFKNSIGCQMKKL